MCVCEQPHVWVYVSKVHLIAFRHPALAWKAWNKPGPVHPPVSPLVLLFLFHTGPSLASVHLPEDAHHLPLRALALPSGASSHPSSHPWLFRTLWFSV